MNSMQGEMRNSQKIPISNSQGSDQFGDAEILTDVIFNLISYKEGVRIHIVQDGVYLWALVRKMFNLQSSLNGGEFFKLNSYS
jgi:hypothetical protein